MLLIFMVVTRGRKFQDFILAFQAGFVVLHLPLASLFYFLFSQVYSARRHSQLLGRCYVCGEVRFILTARVEILRLIFL